MKRFIAQMYLEVPSFIASWLFSIFKSLGFLFCVALLFRLGVGISNSSTTRVHLITNTLIGIGLVVVARKYNIEGYDLSITWSNEYSGAK